MKVASILRRDKDTGRSEMRWLLSEWKRDRETFKGEISKPTLAALRSVGAEGDPYWVLDTLCFLFLVFSFPFFCLLFVRNIACAAQAGLELKM